MHIFNSHMSFNDDIGELINFSDTRQFATFHLHWSGIKPT